MAGYIMTIGSEEYLDLFYAVTASEKPRKHPPNKASSKGEGQQMAKEYALELCIKQGIYSAKSSGKGVAFLGTLADYLGMKQGDNIYFFTDRKIYGIGELVNVAGRDCRFVIRNRVDDIPDNDLIETPDRDSHQFVCFFRPHPYFFKCGIDMDEALTIHPEKIKALRFFSGKSFIKLDDIENEEIKNLIARKNEEYLGEFSGDHHFVFDSSIQNNVAAKLCNHGNEYDLSVFDYIQTRPSGNVTSEYYIEGAIMDLLREYNSLSIGKWDFISRQYPASPPKPSEYVEAMDLFGYRYVEGFPTAISKYLVIELKVGTICQDNVQQTMKYVDWISREYTGGDYSMIEAYTIGYDKEDNIEEDIQDIVERNYIISSRPVKNRKWSNLRILSYLKLLEELKDKNNVEEQ